MTWQSRSRTVRLPFPLVGCGGSFFDSRRGLRGCGEGPDFLDRADADPVGLAQSTIDRTGLRHAHFGTVDKEGDIGRIGVTVTDKARGALGRIDRCFQDKPTGCGVAKRIDGLNVNATAFLATCEPDQAGVRDVPTVIQIDQVTGTH